MKRRALTWLAANGQGVSLAALAVAGFLAFFQTSIVIAPAGEVRSLTATPSYVGSLTLQKGNHTGTDAGFGLGVPNDRESNDLLRKVRPTLYIPFHPDLKVTAGDLARGIKPGFTYTMDLWQGQIISIADENRSIISREEYGERVAQRKTLFLYWATAIAVIAALVWTAAAILNRRTRGEV
ncbi:hypothetical protein H8N03_25900 [Ramlibacter sp. USB13]|uniref:Uncharacterized protein n=1 Tax=Ramlibacter cellulosilyticus TaxID=2764187 RepID=A0A923MWL0_9BURK|nr:hypothetical protein [Ramlibacter cellulosilyticus]MBC5786396.1 hypothetical protein [Ramlibacter cellulosilyticus]